MIKRNVGEDTLVMARTDITHSHLLPSITSNDFAETRPPSCNNSDLFPSIHHWNYESNQQQHQLQSHQNHLIYPHQYNMQPTLCYPLPNSVVFTPICIKPQEYLYDMLIRKSIQKLSMHPWISISVSPSKRRYFIYHMDSKGGRRHTGCGITVEAEEYFSGVSFESRKELLVKRTAIKALKQRFHWLPETEAMRSSAVAYGNCPVAARKPIRFRKKIERKASPLRNEIILDGTADEEPFIDLILQEESKEKSRASAKEMVDQPLPCTWEEIFREMNGGVSVMNVPSGSPLPLSSLSSSPWSAIPFANKPTEEDYDKKVMSAATSNLDFIPPLLGRKRQHQSSLFVRDPATMTLQSSTSPPSAALFMNNNSSNPVSSLPSKRFKSLDEKSLLEPLSPSENSLTFLASISLSI